ncbi:MAG: phosphoenolpyruvate--protein phosphotransferase [Caldilineaceae bacterium]
MISIVLVSHSETLAQGVLQLARQMVQERVQIAVAAGTDNADEPIGTDPMKVLAAIETVYSDDGVLILMDLGSALMSAEAAIEFLEPEQQAHVYLCEAPLVEGGLAAAVAASGGGDIEFVLSEAREALADKLAQLRPVLRIPPPPPEAIVDRPRAQSNAADLASSLELTLTLPNRLGLHARPAARLVNALASFTADVQVEHGGRTVNARSLNKLVTLGTHQGDEVTFRFSGADAEAARQAVQQLAADNFGDRDDAQTQAVASQPAPALDPHVDNHRLHGIAASSGAAVGPIYLWDQRTPTVSTEPAEDIEAEWRKLTQALAAVQRELVTLEQDTKRAIGAEAAAIFQAQQLMLSDPDLLAQARATLETTRLNAAAVWQRTIDETAKGYQALADTYLRERAADLEDVGRRVLRHLAGEGGAALALTQPSIMIAADLPPSAAARLPVDLVLGLLLKRGGATSHSAILARSLGIPAVVGLGDALEELSEGQIVGLDGHTGQVWLAPIDAEIEALHSQRAAWQAEQLRLRQMAQGPTYTQDGQRIEIAANIGNAAEARTAAALGAEGVGLFRTEFLFMERDAPPSEDEQVEAYTAAAQALNGAPVIIRTLDVGGDKPIPYLNQPPEENPFLGLRGIRFCLAQPALFRTQLRALLRVGAEQNIRIMLPMVSSLREVKETQVLIEEVKRELSAAGIPYSETPQVGIMIETPAAVWAADALARAVDFFSIGSNDLTQYIMAADRGNAGVAKLISPLQPAVLRAMQHVVQAAHAADIWVGICGELAGNPLAAPLLVGLGLDELSMSAPMIPQVKDVIRGLTTAEAQQLAAKALECQTPAEVASLLQHWADF